MSVFGVFLVCVFLHLDWIQRDTPYLSVFSPHVGRYGPENFWIRMCIPLRGNSVYILFISSERIRIFKLNLAALTQVSIEPFSGPYKWNLKYLRMRKRQILITTSYLKISWHDMNLNLHWGYILISKVDQWFYLFPIIINIRVSHNHPIIDVYFQQIIFLDN